MTDDLSPPSADEQRAGLQHIMHYRRLRREIRASGTGALIWGALMMFRWNLLFNRPGKVEEPLSILHLVLAIAELSAGVWKKLFPVPEAFILDGFVLLGFGIANGYWAYTQQQAGNRVDKIGLFLAVWMAFAGIGQFRKYRDLLRARFRRPSGEQLRWFDDLVADTRAADPEADATSLDLPTEPPLRVKLLGDIALTLEPGQQEPDIVDRHAVHLDRYSGHDGRPVGELLVHGSSYGTFPLDEYNWKNYAAWKTAGGEPPPAEIPRLHGE